MTSRKRKRSTSTRELDEILGFTPDDEGSRLSLQYALEEEANDEGIGNDSDAINEKEDEISNGHSSNHLKEKASRVEIQEDLAPKEMSTTNKFGTMSVPQAPLTMEESSLFTGSSCLGPTPKITNIVSSVDLKCKLDLKDIALKARNAEYNPKRFAGLVMRIRSPHSTALVFSSGKLICNGCRTESDSKLAARKYARIIQKIGYEKVKFTNFKIVNMAGTFNMKSGIKYKSILESHKNFCSYEPEIFPGLVYRMLDPKCVALIFVTGKVVIVGLKQRSALIEASRNLWAILNSCRTGITAKALSQY